MSRTPELKTPSDISRIIARLGALKTETQDLARRIASLAAQTTAGKLQGTSAPPPPVTEPPSASRVS